MSTAKHHCNKQLPLPFHFFLLHTSVPSMAMVRTVFPPRCCATSSTRRTLWFCTSRAFRICGSSARREVYEQKRKRKKKREKNRKSKVSVAASCKTKAEPRTVVELHIDDGADDRNNLALGSRGGGRRHGASCWQRTERGEKKEKLEKLGKWHKNDKKGGKKTRDMRTGET